MITLTLARQVLSVLGGSATTAYDKVVLSIIHFDTANKRIDATLNLTSTTTPTMQPLQGRLLIDINSSTLEIEIGKIDFYRRITLSAGQKTSVQNIIDGAQNPLEAGLVTLGVIDGTQSAGT